MNPWIAKAVALAATVAMMAIRGPHGQRSRSVKVAKSHKTALETGLLVFAWVGFFIPLVWVASRAFRTEWASRNRAELEANWKNMKDGRTLEKIEPLQ